MSNEKIHEEVKRAYTEALRLSQKATRTGGCCTPAPAEPCCAPPKAESCCTSAVSLFAGYGAERELHKEASASSFGCGNPLAFSAVEPGQTVLDLGSGAGFDLLIAADKVGPSGRVIGVDMTEAMIDAARRNAAAAGHSNVEVRQGQIEALPVESASVDWVISNCVINLSPDKPAVFAEIARVLKPGGRFSISDLVAQDLPDWVRKSAAAYAACIAGAISETDYTAGLRAAGLEDVEVTERVVYTAAQIRAMVEHDLQIFGIDPDAMAAAFAEVEGKVWSAKVTGRKPV